MNYVLLILLIYLAFISYFLNAKRLLSPSMMLIGGFILCNLVLIFMEFRWLYEISINTVIVIVFSIVCFITGEYIAQKVVSNKNRNFDNTLNLSYVTFRPKQNSSFVLFIIAYSLLVIILQTIYFLNISALLGNTEGLLGVFNFGFDIRSFVTHNDINRNYLETFIIKSFLPVAYVSFFIFILNKQSRKKVKWNFFFVIPMISNIIVELLTTNRIGIIYSGIFMTLCYILLFLHKKNWSYKSNKKILKFLLVSSILVFLLFRVTGFVTGRGLNTSFFDQISIYTGASLVALDKGVLGVANVISNFQTLFSGVFRITNSFGLTNIALMSSNAPFVFWNGYSTNIYTAIYTYISALGYIGNFIVFFAMGVTFGVIYYRIIKSFSIFNVVVFSWLAFIPILSSIAERFFTHLFIAFTIIQFIEFWYLSRYVSRKIFLTLKERRFRNDFYRNHRKS